MVTELSQNCGQVAATWVAGSRGQARWYQWVTVLPPGDELSAFLLPIFEIGRLSRLMCALL